MMYGLDGTVRHGTSKARHNHGYGPTQKRKGTARARHGTIPNDANIVLFNFSFISLIQGARLAKGLVQACSHEENISCKHHAGKHSGKPKQILLCIRLYKASQTNSYTHKQIFGARVAAKLWKGADLMEPPRIQAKCMLCRTATHMCNACSAAPQALN